MTEVLPGCAEDEPGTPDPVLADLVRLTALALGAPFACLSIGRGGALWSSAAAALPPESTGGHDPFRSLADDVGAGDLIAVPDIPQDSRVSAANFTVAGRVIRSYAGCCLRSRHGRIQGVLGLYGCAPRVLAGPEADMLRLLARQAAELAELSGRLIDWALLPQPPAPDLTRALVESAPVAIYHAEAGSVTYSNPEYRRLLNLGANPGPDDWAEAVHAADRARTEAAWNDFCQNPRPVKFEYRTSPADGRVRHLCEQLVPALGAAGFVGTISDFTDLVTARGDLRSARNLYHATFDQTPIGVLHTDRDGRILRSNPAFGRMLGRPDLDFAERARDDFTHAEDVAATVLEIGRLWRGELEVIDLEKRYLAQDGSALWVRATTALVRGADGSPECAVEFVRDISSRKALAAALLEQQTLLEAVISDLPVALLVCDPAGRITHHNRAAVELHLVHADGSSAPIFLADGVTQVAAAELPLARALRGEPVGDLELVIAAEQAPRRITLSSARRLVALDGRLLGAVAVIQDISARKQSELDLERVHKQLMSASRQAGMAEVATNVLHNVGNILNSVNISASLVAERIRQSKAPGVGRVAALLREQGDGLAHFLGSDERGRRIPDYLAALGAQLADDQAVALQEIASLRENLEHIKDTVAMQQNYAKLCGVTETVAPADLVEDSLRLNEGAFARHGVSVEREFERVPDITVDKHKVLQILVNLIRNAKYACDESGRGDKRVVLRVEPCAIGVRIAVIDNGVGIPPQNMGRLFSHGFTTRKSGHGFGLHSGALAAQDLGGSLRAESAGAGCGAAFVLELPCRPAESAHA